MNRTAAAPTFGYQMPPSTPCAAASPVPVKPKPDHAPSKSKHEAWPGKKPLMLQSAKTIIQGRLASTRSLPPIYGWPTLNEVQVRGLAGVL